MLSGNSIRLQQQNEDLARYALSNRICGAERSKSKVVICLRCQSPAALNELLIEYCFGLEDLCG